MKNLSITQISPLAFTCTFLLTSAVCLFPELSIAASTSFGDIGNNVTENSKGIAEAIKFMGYTGGIGSAVWGCFDMFNAGNGRGNATYATGGKKVGIGALLLSIGAIISTFSTTLFGSDVTSGMGELGL